MTHKKHEVSDSRKAERHHVYCWRVYYGCPVDVKSVGAIAGSFTVRSQDVFGTVKTLRKLYEDLVTCGCKPLCHTTLKNGITGPELNAKKRVLSRLPFSCN